MADGGVDEEVIGDMSEFEVTTGGYYLCRRDLFGSETSGWLNWLFGDNVHHTFSQGWRKSLQSHTHYSSMECYKSDLAIEIVMLVELDNEESLRMYNMVNQIKGISCFTVHSDTRRLIVTGNFDPGVVVKDVWKMKSTAEILSIRQIEVLLNIYGSEFHYS
ncbi:hypothetical protein L1987_01473 [Smallanthus sonchifolius]|uniref:Uncharacterized protein n=1 Tax=Smallanthus sonchifolius TaxID=185202 RepID=A0ACB9K522_9ASTR|nr:hypothetical protein L1987_01473 [Smallanthus sonchifolius]